MLHFGPSLQRKFAPILTVTPPLSPPPTRANKTLAYDAADRHMGTTVTTGLVDDLVEADG